MIARNTLHHDEVKAQNHDTNRSNTEVAADGTFPADATNKPKPSRSRRIARWMVNIWLVMHLTAIIAAPATVGPSSQTARSVWTAVGPYLELCYLNHGFHYFAPQPGSSNLVSWTVTLEDGSTKSGRFPNFDIKPRLFYHRHFMLSEFFGNSSPDLQRVIVRGIAKNLCREHNAVSAAVSTVRHDLPSIERIRAGAKLNDSDLYEEQPMGIFQWAELQ